MARALLTSLPLTFSQPTPNLRSNLRCNSNLLCHPNTRCQANLRCAYSTFLLRM